MITGAHPWLGEEEGCAHNSKSRWKVWCSRAETERTAGLTAGTEGAAQTAEVDVSSVDLAADMDTTEVAGHADVVSAADVASYADVTSVADVADHAEVAHGAVQRGLDEAPRGLDSVPREADITMQLQAHGDGAAQQADDTAQGQTRSHGGRWHHVAAGGQCPTDIFANGRKGSDVGKSLQRKPEYECRDPT